MPADYPEAYDHNPGMEFLDKAPTVCRDTKVLNGVPAEYITVARQHGDAWYLGSMTNWDGRDLELPWISLVKVNTKLRFSLTARTRRRWVPA
jgi:alpha-glucosidase